MEKKNQKQKIQEQDKITKKSFFARQNEQILLLVWFVLVIIQWNCIGETLSIINLKEQNQTRFKIGVVGELIINFIFCLDFLLYKKNNYKNIESYSKVYLVNDILAGPVALIADIVTLVFQNQLNIYSTVFRCSKALSLCQARRIFKKVNLIIPKVQDMFLALFFVFYLFTYIATYLYGDLFRTKYYFNSIGFSFFTMLQIMTLDGWGEIGRDILRRQNMLSASFLIVFVLIVGYFFWNLLIGFMLDIVGSFEQSENNNSNKTPQNDNQLIVNKIEVQQNNEQSTKAKNQKSNKKEKATDDKSQISNHPTSTLNGQVNSDEQSITQRKVSPETQTKKNVVDNKENSKQKQNENSKENKNLSESESFYENFCIGSLYKKIVICLYLKLMLDSMFKQDLTNINSIFSIILHLSTSIFYTVHTLCIYIQNTHKFKIERQNTWMIFFHLISGPVSLFFDISSIYASGNIGIGGIFKLFKIFTVTGETIVGAIVIFPTLLPAFLGIISIIFPLSLWSSSYLKNVENFWVDFDTSVYTFVQILTLDDWAAKLVKDLLKQNKYLTPVVFIGFIFVANYFFLNMMIALSCETFNKVSSEEYAKSKKQKQLHFYEQDDNSSNCQPYNSLNELYQDLDVLKSSEIEKQYNDVIENLGSEKELINQETNLYQQLLQAKHRQIDLTQPITFTLNGKTVKIEQKDLVYLKFNLCNKQKEQLIK